MDRQLINYLPPVLREVQEFQVINEANEPEISAAWDALARLMANQFLDTADSAGVSIWEQELVIRPQDTDTLEIRKARIRSLWNSGGSYPYKWLAEWLKSVCGDEYRAPEVSEYTVRTAIPISADYTNILENLRRRISANMLISPLILLSKIDTNHGIGMASRCSVRSSVQTPTWDTSNIDVMTDENGVGLTDEFGTVFFEEVTA